MRIDIVSLFPEYFKGPFDESMIARARRQGLVDIHLVDLRQYGIGNYRQVDDRAYGGGPGMVLMAEPVTQALREAKACKQEGSQRVIYLSPQGAPFNAAKCRELAMVDHLILLCGHYEGVDQRVIDREVDEEISIGDYVLTNGCLPAIVVVDAVARFIPGVIGHSDAAAEDSFEKDLLDCPHYTRPELFEGTEVPKVLLEGNHAAITQWRRERSIAKTQRVRPDLMVRHLLRHQEGGEKEAASSDGNRFKGVTLLVRDLRRSRRYYRDILGLRPVNENETTIVFVVGRVEVMLTAGLEGLEGPRSVIFEVTVEETALLAQIAHRVQKSGTGGVKSNGEIERVWFTDPDGYVWVLARNSKQVK